MMRSEYRQADAVDRLFTGVAILPVVTLERVEDAVPMAQALLDGGVNCIELTLRTPAGLAAIESIRKSLPQILVGAGTVRTPGDLRDAQAAGAAFAISPGMTPTLLQAAGDASIPLIAGVATASDILTGLEYGHRRFKLYPAGPLGGPKILRAFQGPFPEVRFCPTGGISADQVTNYLALANVFAVGGSWMVPEETLLHRDFDRLTQIVRAALSRLGSKPQ